MPVEARNLAFVTLAGLLMLPGLVGVTAQAADLDILMNAPASTSKSPALPMDQMAERLRLRLEREPNDLQGWVLLGKSYEFLGQGEQAQAAFERARALGYTDENTAATSGTHGGSVNPVIMQGIADTIHAAQRESPPSTDTLAPEPQSPPD